MHITDACSSRIAKNSMTQLSHQMVGGAFGSNSMFPIRTIGSMTANNHCFKQLPTLGTNHVEPVAAHATGGVSFARTGVLRHECDRSSCPACVMSSQAAMGIHVIALE
ncbi:hypothetical protein [Dyella sp. C11]|uniref:hypothetical protein n=1 Tax=Dyella sp. C11 TaxID=2126991 RepID=UPI000D657141|nr:hypothetical protein [Dyella sp. C11]